MLTHPRRRSHTLVMAFLACLVIVAGLIVAWWFTSRPLATLNVNSNGTSYRFELAKTDADMLMLFIKQDPPGSSSDTNAAAILPGADDAWVARVVSQGRADDAEFTFDEQTGMVTLSIADRRWRYELAARQWTAD